ncbi:MULTISPECIES: hypothetical protein [unclassified Bradyrhizobium]
MTKLKKGKRSSSSSSSERTAQSKTTKELLALGGRLVEQFKLRADEDTLGQWIAHHLAEKLLAHKSASGPAKAALEAELVDTILKFWKHRAYFPRGTKPFEGYDAVLRALESFDPRPENSRYFFYPAAEELTKSATAPSQAWIDTAKIIDRGARAMINICFQQAARASKQPDETWISAAKVLAEEADCDVIVIKYVKVLQDDEESVDPTDFERERLKQKREDIAQLVRAGIPLLQMIDEHLGDTGEAADDTAEPKSEKSKPAPKSKARGSKKHTAKQSPKKKAPTRKRRATTGS